MSELTDNHVTAAADLGRRDAERALKPTLADADRPLIVARMRDDERVAVVPLEQHLDRPLQPRGTVTMHDWTHFADYVKRLADGGSTTLWARPDAGRVTAVFDDHTNAVDAGWRRHTAELSLQADPDWQAWIGRNGKLMPQADFADLLEDLAHTVVSPDAATMLEVATTFNAKRNVNFKQGTRLDTGDVQLTYEETMQAAAGHKQNVEVPAAFTVRIAPYLGLEPVEISARLRWRIEGGSLRIGYALLRPDRALRDTMAALVTEITARVDPLPVYLGAPPSPITPL